jgi:hopanoid C-3 methylase
VRILLVHPECQSSRIGFRLAAMPEPLALEILASSVPDHDVRILDMRLDADLKTSLESFQPDVVCVTALTTEVYAAQDVFRRVKDFSDEIFTVVGGYHCSLMPEDFYLPSVDAIAIGEGELVFPQLIRALETDRRLAGVPNLIWRNGEGDSYQVNPRDLSNIDMDALPLPRRDLVKQYSEEYFFLFDKPDSSVATGRGCPYRCNFCSVWEFYGGKTRQMTPQRVLQEVQSVDTDHITFVDDNFLLNYKREDAIADLIRSEGIDMRFSMECRTDSIARHPELLAKWVDIGLYAVLLGLEGANDRALKRVNKKNSSKVNDEAIRILQDNGVIIWGAFLVDPDWEEDDFKQLRDYVTSRQITHTQFTVLTPLPGTELYRERFDELLTYDYRCYDALHAVTPTRLPRERFYELFAGLYAQTDLGPYYDLLREGKLTVADCKRGKAILDTMTRWEDYLELDPVLGDCLPRSEVSPGAASFRDRRSAVDPSPGA